MARGYCERVCVIRSVEPVLLLTNIDGDLFKLQERHVIVLKITFQCKCYSTFAEMHRSFFCEA